MDIQFDFSAQGQEQPDAFLDGAELALMFEGARSSIAAGLRRKLKGVTCAEHQRPPSLVISGVYDREREEMDISYHVDACCQLFLLRVVAAINQRA